jgi:hypothetical protein
MKLPILLFSMLIIIGCNDTENTQATHTTHNIHSEKNDTVNHAIKPVDHIIKQEDSLISVKDFKTFNRYNVSDTIIEDLNGDKVKDKSYFMQAGDKRKLLVMDGRTNRIFELGADPSFEGVGNNFNWVDFWGLTKDRTTYEIIVTNGDVSGSKEVHLRYPSLVLIKEEVGGGVVTYKDSTYKWVQQAD